MLYINISFDYELFFGTNYGSNREVLFEPTERIANILSEEETYATFFADVCSVAQHRKYEIANYCDTFETQIKHLRDEGNDIQLHIHPHWLRSVYDGSKWVFDNTSFGLDSYAEEENELSIKNILGKSIDYLNNLLSEGDNKYRCVAYRAGGYCLNPYSELISLLHSKGILIDSSVAMFQKSTVGAAQKYNYMQLPDSLNYYLVPGIPLEKSTLIATPNALFEVPVGYYKKSILIRLFWGKNRITFERGKSRGTGVKPLTVYQKVPNLAQRFISYGNEYQKLSLDYTNAKFMIRSLHQIYKKYHCANKNAFISIIGHPKSFGGEAFENLALFIRMVKQESDKYSFVRMSDIPMMNLTDQFC